LKDQNEFDAFINRFTNLKKLYIIFNKEELNIKGISDRIAKNIDWLFFEFQ
jgi:hypothetical protein